MQEKETTNWRRFDEEFKRRAVEMIESGALHAD
jgi:transposase-like protein